jgi:hypothetical protein
LSFQNPLDGGDESDAQDLEMNKKMKRTSRSDDYFYDDDYDYDYYYKYPRKGCRNKHGQKGSEHHEFDVYFQKSRHSCESKCNKLGYECYGYEFGVHDKKCEIWRVPIYDVEYVKGLDCYVKN